MLDSLADDIELALELRVALERGAWRRRAWRARDEELLEHGLDGDSARPHEPVIGRNIAPAENELALVNHDLLDDRLDPLTNRRIAREKHQAGPVAALRRQREPQALGLFAEEPIGHLNQDAGAISRVGLASARPAVQQVDKQLQRGRDDGVALATLDVDEEADATGVVLVPRIVKSLGWHRLVAGTFG